MSNMSKELLREYTKEQNFSNTNDILAALKEMFREVFRTYLYSVLILDILYFSTLEIAKEKTIS